MRSRPSRQRIARTIIDHYAVVGVVLTAVAITVSLGPVAENRVITALAAFCLGAGASIFATGLSERAQNMRQAAGLRLELLGRDAIERPAHMLYPDFLVGPETNNTSRRNLRIYLSQELSFSPVNLRFVRHVAKEDMDAVRFMNLFFHDLGVHAKGIQIRRDSAFLQDNLDVSHRNAALTPEGALSTASAQSILRDLRHSVVVIGLGSNIVTKVYATLPDALLRLAGDLQATGGKFEPVDVVAPTNCHVVDNILNDEAIPSMSSSKEYLAAMKDRWRDDIIPLSVPPRVSVQDAPKGYRFQSDSKSYNHFGFIVRKTLDQVLERRLLIVGGSGPLGTRAAALYILHKADELAQLVRHKEAKGDFIAVVHACEQPLTDEYHVDYVPPLSIREPTLQYVVVRPVR